MKKLSTLTLMALTLTALGFHLWVEQCRVPRGTEISEEKVAAVSLTEKAFAALAEAKQRAGMEVTPFDPKKSGLIGANMTPVTTNPGVLPAKQLSTNPEFAAVFVDMLQQFDLRPKDRVAVSFTGSFPALNIAALAAFQVLQLEPIIISSLSASQWGANEPGWLWLDLEKILVANHILRARSTAVTYGGIEDRALGLSAEGLGILNETLRRHADVAFLEVKDYEDGLNQRFQLYHRSEKPVKLFFNIGGGTTSVGKKVGKLRLKPGINRHLPLRANTVDSVADRFLRQGIPVIHIGNVQELAKQYGLNSQGPLSTKTPRALAGVLVLVFVAMLLGCRFI